MPDSKTIEIDEIITPDKSAGGSQGSAKGDPPNFTGSSKHASPEADGADFDPDKLFSNLHKSLPWKARLTLTLTRWFMLLRSKSWGIFILVPLIMLAIFLAIPVVIIVIIAMTARALFSPRRD